MCVCDANFRKPETATRTLYAYKIVRPIRRGEYSSVMPPDCRFPQFVDWPHQRVGITKLYELNRPCRSLFANTPGIYCYARKKDALRHARTSLGMRTVIKVRIRKGTRFVRGSFGVTSSGVGTINAEEITPIQEIN